MRCSAGLVLVAALLLASHVAALRVTDGENFALLEDVEDINPDVFGLVQRRMADEASTPFQSFLEEQANWRGRVGVKTGGSTSVSVSTSGRVSGSASASGSVSGNAHVSGSASGSVSGSASASVSGSASANISASAAVDVDVDVDVSVVAELKVEISIEILLKLESETKPPVFSDCCSYWSAHGCNAGNTRKKKGVDPLSGCQGEECEEKCCEPEEENDKQTCQSWLSGGLGGCPDDTEEITRHRNTKCGNDLACRIKCCKRTCKSFTRNPNACGDNKVPKQNMKQTARCFHPFICRLICCEKGENPNPPEGKLTCREMIKRGEECDGGRENRRAFLFARLANEDEFQEKCCKDPPPQKKTCKSLADSGMKCASGKQPARLVMREVIESGQQQEFEDKCCKMTCGLFFKMPTNCVDPKPLQRTGLVMEEGRRRNIRFKRCEIGGTNTTNPCGTVCCEPRPPPKCEEFFKKGLECKDGKKARKDPNTNAVSESTFQHDCCNVLPPTCLWYAENKGLKCSNRAKPSGSIQISSEAEFEEKCCKRTCLGWWLERGDQCRAPRPKQKVLAALKGCNTDAECLETCCLPVEDNEKTCAELFKTEKCPNDSKNGDPQATTKKEDFVKNCCIPKHTCSKYWSTAGDKCPQHEEQHKDVECVDGPATGGSVKACEELCCGTPAKKNTCGEWFKQNSDNGERCPAGTGPSDEPGVELLPCNNNGDSPCTETCCEKLPEEKTCENFWASQKTPCPGGIKIETNSGSVCDPKTDCEQKCCQEKPNDPLPGLKTEVHFHNGYDEFSLFDYFHPDPDHNYGRPNENKFAQEQENWPAKHDETVAKLKAIPAFANLVEGGNRIKDLRLILGGHASKLGTFDLNLVLSRNRVISAMCYLGHKWLPARGYTNWNLRPGYYGEEQGQLSATPIAQQLDRRVDILWDSPQAKPVSPYPGNRDLQPWIHPGPSDTFWTTTCNSHKYKNAGADDAWFVVRAAQPAGGMNIDASEIQANNDGTMLANNALTEAEAINA